jgi:DNA-directed RNA polymerase I and III subunit RPAC1
MPSKYDPREHVGVHAERVSHVSSTNFPGHYPDEDHSWDLERFAKVRSKVLDLYLTDLQPCKDRD